MHDHNAKIAVYGIREDGWKITSLGHHKFKKEMDLQRTCSRNSKCGI